MSEFDEKNSESEKQKPKKKRYSEEEIEHWNHMANLSPDDFPTEEPTPEEVLWRRKSDKSPDDFDDDD